MSPCASLSQEGISDHVSVLNKFSTDYQYTVKTSSKVRMPSMNTPRTSDVSLDNVVRTLNSVGNNTFTRNDAKMLPASCTTRSMMARNQPIVLVIAIARVTAGL